MAHEVETMAYAGATPWHGLGTKVEDPEVQKDWARFMIACGLDWEVERTALVTLDGGQDVSDFAQAVRRKSDQRVLGVVGARYVPKQNAEIFEWFEPFLASGECSFETGGSLFGGSRIWALAKINRDPIVISGSDIVQKNLLLSHAHDGSLAINAGLTPTRVVCNNTLSIALAGGKTNFFKARHTAGASGKLDQIREQIAMADQAFEKVAESYRFLASRRIQEAQVATYVRRVMGFAEEGRLTTKADNIVSGILTRVYSGLGQTQSATEGTYWQAYNGVTEYLSHDRGHNADTKLNSLWFGDSAAKNDKALELAMELAVAA